MFQILHKVSREIKNLLQSQKVSIFVVVNAFRLIRKEYRKKGNPDAPVI